MRPVWHFDTIDVFKRAMHTGALTAHAAPHQKPLLWFSPDGCWAPTITVGRGRTARFLSFQEASAEGLYRFGMPPSSLLTGRELRRQAKLSNREWELFRAGALAAGADPSEWFGHVGPLNLFDVIIDRADEAGWTRIKRMRRVAGAGYVVLHDAPVRGQEGGG
jgi:hypothetical protein